MNYSKAVRVARSLADLSQGQLADRAEIDRSYLSLIESGKRQPTIGTMEKIARALKMPFHLLSLLASEEEDVQKASIGQIESLSLALTELLMQVDTHGTEDIRPKATPTRPGAPKKRQGTRISPRRKSRDAVAVG